MQSPGTEIGLVFRQLLSPESPDTQKAAVYKYFTPDASLYDPWCQIKRDNGSRESILRVYQVYRVLSPHSSLGITCIVHDEENNILHMDVCLSSHIFFSPIRRGSPARFIVRLELEKQDNAYLISRQESFLHPDELTMLILPPAASLVRLALGVCSKGFGLFVKAFQLAGYWRPGDATGITKASDGEAERKHVQSGHVDNRAQENRDKTKYQPCYTYEA
ncbi:hypothetical protein F5887DRAFT_884783 [Amanita rubescens]|nr:hypothetical protein F5887DRAFT_884783 [Amanita rubescens]